MVAYLSISESLDSRLQSVVREMDFRVTETSIMISDTNKEPNRIKSGQ